jgi:hypothetical protein
MDDLYVVFQIDYRDGDRTTAVRIFDDLQFATEYVNENVDRQFGRYIEIVPFTRSK